MTARFDFITSLGKKTTWEQTIDVMNEMRSHRMKPCVVTYCSAISVCTRGSQWSRALKVLDDMQSALVQPNVVTYNSAIKACGVGLHWAGALEILDQMLVSGVPSNERTHNTLLAVFVKAHLWQTALQLLDYMPSFGVEPDVISYNTVLNGCHSCGQWRHALHLFSCMQRSSITPDVRTYNSLMKSPTPWACSLAALREMRENATLPQPDVATYGAAISSCARCNQWVQALALLNEWRAAGNEPDELMLMSVRKSRAKWIHKSSRTFLVPNISPDEPLHFEKYSETAQAASQRCNAGVGTAADIHSSSKARTLMSSQGQRDQWAHALRLLQKFENCTPHWKTERKGRLVVSV